MNSIYQFITVSYEQVKAVMYHNGIDKLDIPNVPDIQLHALNERLTNYKTYPVAVLKRGSSIYLLCKNQKYKEQDGIFTWSYNRTGQEKAHAYDYVQYIDSSYKILKIYDYEAFSTLDLSPLYAVATIN